MNEKNKLQDDTRVLFEDVTNAVTARCDELREYLVTDIVPSVREAGISVINASIDGASRLKDRLEGEAKDVPVSDDGVNAKATVTDEDGNTFDIPDEMLHDADYYRALGVPIGGDEGDQDLKPRYDAVDALQEWAESMMEHTDVIVDDDVRTSKDEWLDDALTEGISVLRTARMVTLLNGDDNMRQRFERCEEMACLFMMAIVYRLNLDGFSKCSYEDIIKDTMPDVWM